VNTSKREAIVREAKFRMLMLCAVLAEDYGVPYDAERRAGPAATRVDDGFFADPGAVFVHGLVGGRVQGPKSNVQSLELPSAKPLDSRHVSAGTGPVVRSG
jgi:hypothetical protein